MNLKLMLVDSSQDFLLASGARVCKSCNCKETSKKKNLRRVQNVNSVGETSLSVAPLSMIIESNQVQYHLISILIKI